ncbi:MAG: arginine--tRNA ligase, partial [Acidobacteriota bacterium]
MILPLHETVRTALSETVRRLYGLDEASLPVVAVETPPNRAMGDLAVPLAFELARRLRKAPRMIAQEIANAMSAPEGVTRIVAAPNGYIN